MQWYAHDLMAFMLWGSWSNLLDYSATSISLSIQSNLFFLLKLKEVLMVLLCTKCTQKGGVFNVCHSQGLTETIWVMCTLKRVPSITKISTRRACFERCALAKVLITYYGLVHFKTSAYHRQGFNDNILGLVCTKWDAYCIQGYNGPTFWTKCIPKVVLTIPKVPMETMQTINFLKGMPTKAITSMRTIFLFMKTQKCMHIVM